MSFTNAQLAQKIADLIEYWSSFNEEYSNWLGGTVDGGPSSDGNYPLTPWDGDEQLVASPAKLADGCGPAAAGMAVPEHAVRPLVLRQGNLACRAREHR